MLLPAFAKNKVARVKQFIWGVFLSLILAAGGLWWIAHPECTALPKRLYHEAVLRETDYIGPDVRFRVRMMGSGRTPEGFDSDFTDVRATDCVEVTVETESTESPEQAEAKLKKEVQSASQVLNEEAFTILPKHPNGVRAVLFFAGERKAEIVIWLKGESRLHIFQSSSLAHALTYEKLTQKGYRFDASGYVMAASN